MNFSSNETTCAPLRVCGENGEIYAMQYAPASDAAEKYPVVILCHAYNCTLESVSDYAEKLAALGFIAITFDFCGGCTRSKSSGSPLEMSLKTELADLMAVSAAARELPIADKDRVFLYGESQGGCVAALAAGECSDDFAGLAMMYPALCIPYDWRRITENGTPDTYELFGMTISKKFADGVPREDIFALISRFEKPVLILHGDSDEIVNISYSERAEKAYKNARLSKYIGEGHGFSPKARAAALARIHDFLKNAAK